MKKTRLVAFFMCLALLMGTFALTSCDTRKPSQGFAYEVNEDGKSCTITGMGTCVDTALIFPSQIDGYTVTAIAERAFWEQKDITEIDISDSVTTVGQFAFASCSNLKTVTIPKSATVFSEGVFVKDEAIEVVYYEGDLVDWCGIQFAESFSSPLASLAEPDLYFGNWLVSDETEITIPDSVTEIGSYSFSLFRNVTKINLPDGLTNIPDGAFRACKSLAEVTIPESVTSIGNRAFGGCAALQKLYIPVTVTSIDQNAFALFSGVANIEFEGTVEQWHAVYPAYDGMSVFVVHCSDGDAIYSPMLQK